MLRSEQVEDLLNCAIGLLIGGFDWTARFEVFVGSVMEQRVGQRPTDALVEQDEHEGGFGRSGVG
jgi:hypothetical protein